jgi:hypothetical protein
VLQQYKAAPGNILIVLPDERGEIVVLPDERSECGVIPGERSERIVIPGKRSECSVIPHERAERASVGIYFAVRVTSQGEKIPTLASLVRDDNVDPDTRFADPLRGYPSRYACGMRDDEEG